MTGAADEPQVNSVQPVASTERITAMDTLRGVAVLGILVMNIYGFAMPFIAYNNPLALGGTEWHNIGTWFFTHLFFDMKFMTIFSLLFGGGMILMWQRAEAAQAKFGRIYYRRQLWLMLIGMLHGYLIWFGDILFHYALIGMFIYLFRKLQARTLIIIGICMLPVALLFSYGGALVIEDMQQQMVEIRALNAAGEALSEEQIEIEEQWESMRPMMAPNDQDLRDDLDAYHGDYADIVRYRAPQVLEFQLQATIFFILWRAGGLMLIGMALMKLGILSANRSPQFYRRMLLLGYGLGLPLVIYSAFNLYEHDFDSLHSIRVGMIPNYIGSVFVAFGHIGAVMLMIKAGVWAGLLRRFAAVGRMALSNYLLHSIILTTVFYGYGLGLYGNVPRLAQMAFVVAVIGLQLFISPIWLRRYRFGPLEWLWRSLTYWRRQPMRRED